MPRWFALLLCAAGAAMILLGLRQSARGKASRAWTRTPGRVTAAYVEEVPWPAEDGGPRFRPVVRYTYEARGRTYESEQVEVGASPPPWTSPDRDLAQRTVDRFPAGREVVVWFDPARPDQAVLVPGAARSQLLLAVAVGLALVGVGLFALAR